MNMDKKQFAIGISVVFLSAVLFAFIWEFYLESLTLPLFVTTHQEETVAERWEYVISIGIFVAISLLYPALAGIKLISKQNDLHEELQRIANEDHLTKIFNRRKLNNELAAEINRCLRYKHVFSIILLDIDNFKITNDELGHTSGDLLLVEITNLIKQIIREPDIVGRWGGEEFLIICPETEIEGAKSLADKIRTTLASAQIPDIGAKTASFGVTSYRSDDDIESIIQRVDKALYAAKYAGKNRVETVI